VTKSYFCRHIIHARRAVPENTNGITGQFLPKGTNFDNTSTDDRKLRL
jgi:IS30 family transposase